jgi:hypothetical protein
MVTSWKELEPMARDFFTGASDDNTSILGEVFADVEGIASGCWTGQPESSCKRSVVEHDSLSGDYYKRHNHRRNFGPGQKGCRCNIVVHECI